MQQLCFNFFFGRKLSGQCTMGFRAPSLADMDSFEVSRKRRPVMHMRSVNVIMWRVDGSAVVAAHRRTRSADCCTNALWRRMMCARRIKGPHHVTEDDAYHSDSDDRGFLELGQPHKAPMLTEIGSKLQSAFNMRRWPQGWI